MMGGVNCFVRGGKSVRAMEAAASGSSVCAAQKRNTHVPLPPSHLPPSN
jgi:hypothetical protein